LWRCNRAVTLAKTISSVSTTSTVAIKSDPIFPRAMNAQLTDWLCRLSFRSAAAPIQASHLVALSATIRRRSETRQVSNLVNYAIQPPTCSSRCELPPSAPPQPHVILPNQVDLPPQPPVSLVARWQSLDSQPAITPEQHGEVKVDGRSLQPSN
jgi:hypothetical protein